MLTLARAVTPPALSGTRWTADRLHREGLDTLIGAAQARLDGLAGTAVDPQVAPSFVFAWYHSALATAATDAHATTGRVPRLHAAAVVLRFADGGWPEDVELLDDTPAERGLETEYLAHSDALVAAWGRRGRRGRHALRGLAADAYASAQAAACAVPQAPPAARIACCLAYKLPGGDLCGGCPRTLLRKTPQGRQDPCSA